MIFVTVGTHEQPFNRLIQKIDELKKDGTIQDDVIIQTGIVTMRPFAVFSQMPASVSVARMCAGVAMRLEIQDHLSGVLCHFAQRIQRRLPKRVNSLMRMDFEQDALLQAI